MTAIKKRRLSSTFLNDLKDGFLRELLKEVHNDETLSLEIRDDYLNIYYRGGSILRLTKEERGYSTDFDDKYCCDKKDEQEFVQKDILPIISNMGNTDMLVDVFPRLKRIMDRWFIRHPKQEREFQQLVVRENNSKGIGKSTDYFIIDVEYDNRNKARFDMVAIEWESDKVLRKLPSNYKPKLCFIEMKYGDGALDSDEAPDGDGASDGDAGIKKHIEDMKKYFDSQGFDSIKEEMTELFKQKRELELIPALVGNRNVLAHDQLADEVDYIFLLANHDPEKSVLCKVLQDVDKAYSHSLLGFNIRFCCSTFMGYGIYKQSVYSIQEFIQRFPKQILCE